MVEALLLFIVYILLDDGELGELQEQLFGAHITELDRGFLVVAGAFQFHHGADTEALVLNDGTFVEGMGRG